jgi:hypothetical protein
MSFLVAQEINQRPHLRINDSVAANLFEAPERDEDHVDSGPSARRRCRLG